MGVLAGRRYAAIAEEIRRRRLLDESTRIGHDNQHIVLRTDHAFLRAYFTAGVLTAEGQCTRKGTEVIPPRQIATRAHTDDVIAQRLVACFRDTCLVLVEQADEWHADNAVIGKLSVCVRTNGEAYVTRGSEVLAELDLMVLATVSYAIMIGTLFADTPAIVAAWLMTFASGDPLPEAFLNTGHVTLGPPVEEITRKDSGDVRIFGQVRSKVDGSQYTAWGFLPGANDSNADEEAGLHRVMAALVEVLPNDEARATVAHALGALAALVVDGVVDFTDEDVTMRLPSLLISGYRDVEAAFAAAGSAASSADSVQPRPTKCPFCAETILAAAIKCRYCHSDLTA